MTIAHIRNLYYVHAILRLYFKNFSVLGFLLVSNSHLARDKTNKTPAMHRDIFRLQLANNRRLIGKLPPLW